MRLRVPTAQDVTNKTVLVRVDYNVPLIEKNGKQVVADDRRIRASLETINFLLGNNAKVVLISHLGRPDGKVDERFRMLPVADVLQKTLNLPITHIAQTIGNDVTAAVQNLQPSTGILLENLRFYSGEEKNEVDFAKQLAELGDIYINDAFAVDHRAHASLEAITHYMPCYAGFNVQKEFNTLNALMANPRRPFIIIVGGAKISDKVGALLHLTKVADLVLVGGGVANNFLKADGLEIHRSYLQDAPADLQKKDIDYVDVAKQLLDSVRTERSLKDGYIPLPKILYPIDVIAAESMDSTHTEIIDLTHDAKDTTNDRNIMYLDIGPKTIRLYTELMKQAGSIFWNGPMGVYEKPPFANGTKAIAEAMAANGAVTVIGGGDTAAAVEQFDLEDKYTYVSTAGSAGLEFLSGAELPGIKPLTITS